MPGTMALVDALTDAFDHIDRLNVRVLRSHVKSSDNLGQALESLRTANVLLNARLSELDSEGQQTNRLATQHVLEPRTYPGPPTPAELVAAINRVRSTPRPLEDGLPSRINESPPHSDLDNIQSMPPTVEISTDPNRALIVSWVSQEMSNFQYKAWLFRLRIHVENQTDQPIRLMHVMFEGPQMATTTPVMYAERERIKRELGVPQNPVPPHGAIDMWYVGEFQFVPDLGEPSYEIRVKAANGGHEYGFRYAGNPKVSVDLPPTP
jgi:hypothetical protein